MKWKPFFSYIYFIGIFSAPNNHGKQIVLLLKKYFLMWAFIAVDKCN